MTGANTPTIDFSHDFIEQSGFGSDPLGEGAAMRTPGLLHK